jgi:hypothetical protein
MIENPELGNWVKKHGEDLAGALPEKAHGGGVDCLW